MRETKTTAFAALTAALLSIAGRADATVLTLETVARGWVDSNGFANGRGAGNTTFTGFADGTGNVNSWYGFDLSLVSGDIVAAELLFDIAPYRSPDATETLVFYDVETPPGQLGTIDSWAHFMDLMTGNELGSRDFSAADDGHSRSITLNAAALVDLNQAAGGLWEVGGHISTLSRVAEYEAVFFGNFGNPSSTRLQLTTDPGQMVPEPATVGLLLLGFAALRRQRIKPAHRR